MIWLKRTLLATGICTAAAAGGWGGAATDPLAEYRWQARPVLVFAPAGDGRMAEQIERFAADGSATRDRDIVLVEIAGGSARAEGRPQDASALRRRFDVADAEFAVILVGKDGTEKKRVAEVTDPRVFFAAIDGMPMRRDEMRRAE